MFTCKVWNLNKFLKVIGSFKVFKNPQHKSKLKILVYPIGVFFSTIYKCETKLLHHLIKTLAMINFFCHSLKKSKLHNNQTS
jgi:hypothetical protein